MKYLFNKKDKGQGIILTIDTEKSQENYLKKGLFRVYYNSIISHQFLNEIKTPCLEDISKINTMKTLGTIIGVTEKFIFLR